MRYDETIREQVLEIVNPKFANTLEEISSNDEWFDLHNKYIDEIIDLTEQLTRKDDMEMVRDVLIDEGLSVVESDRVLESKENFKLAVQDIIEKVREEARKEKWDELRTALRRNEELSQRLDKMIGEIEKYGEGEDYPFSAFDMFIARVHAIVKDKKLEDKLIFQFQDCMKILKLQLKSRLKKGSVK